MTSVSISGIHKSSTIHHNKSYDYENDDKYRQKQKNSLEKCEMKDWKP